MNEAFFAISSTAPTHSVLDHLKALEWDHTPRVDGFFRHYYMLPESEYHTAVAKVLFLSAVWRLVEPGCQADQTVLLVGAEGVGKSYGMGTLFYADKGWVLEHVPDLHSKDAMSALRGKWMVELSEMDAARRAEIETLKAFITRREDHYRPPYAANEVTRPRQCVLVGTSNDYTILDSMDSNRRFLPLLLGPEPSRLDEIKRDRDQLWAEAFTRALAGERHGYLTSMNTPGLDQARQDVAREDPHYDTIASFLAGRDRVRMDDIYEEIGVRTGLRGGLLAKRLAKLLRYMGWRPKSIRDEGVVKHFWVPGDPEMLF